MVMIGRLFTMKKEHNYVECEGCAWQLKNHPERDWEKNPCRRCHNTRKIIDPKEILCNLCGGCMCPIGTMNEQVPHGLHEAKVIGGYDSYHLFDMSRYTFSFCEECLRKLFVQCKIKPRIHDMVFPQILDGDTPLQEGEEETWERDQTSYEYRVWYDNGGYHQAYLDKKCNRVKDCPNQAVYTRLYRGEFTEDCACEEHKNHFFQDNVHSLVKFIPNVLKPFL